MFSTTKARRRVTKPLGWQFVICLALLASLARAAIPVGYMPDAEAAKAGTFALVLCHSYGPLPALEAHHHDHEHGNHDDGAPDDTSTGLECPYAIIAGPAILPDVALHAAFAVYVTGLIAPAAYHPAPALPANGPPLGARAPPYHLA